MPSRRFARALGAGAVGALCYGLYASQRDPLQSAALKNPFALTHKESSAAAERPLAAIAVLLPDGGSGVTGTVTFRQDAPGRPIHIKASIQGLKDGKHGFHVHQVTAHSHRQSTNTATVLALTRVGCCNDCCSVVRQSDSGLRDCRASL